MPISGGLTDTEGVPSPSSHLGGALVTKREMKNRGGAQNGCSLLGGEEGALPMDPAEGYKLGMPASALSDTQPRSVPGSKGGR